MSRKVSLRFWLVDPGVLCNEVLASLLRLVACVNAVSAVLSRVFRKPLALVRRCWAFVQRKLLACQEVFRGNP